MKIINLTAHTPTPEQIAAGVEDLPPHLAATVRQMLDIDVDYLCSVDSRGQESYLSERARAIVEPLMDHVMEEATAKIDVLREQARPRDLTTREIFTLLHTCPCRTLWWAGTQG